MLCLYDMDFFLVHCEMMDWDVAEMGTMILGFAIPTSEGDEEFPLL